MSDVPPTSWAVGVLTILVGWIGKVLHNRVTRLEIKYQTSEQAAKDRAEIIHNQLAMASRMDMQHNILVGRIDDLYRRIRP